MNRGYSRSQSGSSSLWSYSESHSSGSNRGGGGSSYYGAYQGGSSSSYGNL